MLPISYIFYSATTSTDLLKFFKNSFIANCDNDIIENMHCQIICISKNQKPLTASISFNSDKN